MDVGPDYFVGQFDKHPDPHLAACRHAALLLNSIKSERKAHIASLERALAQLRAGGNLIAIALDMDETLRELKE